MSKKKETKRTFDSGAIRDISEGKLEYFGFREPLVEQSFAKYMHQHRKMADGSLRDSNNWWKGWDEKISLQSMVRHVEDLQAIKAGYVVFEIRDASGVHREYVRGIIKANDRVKEYKELGIEFSWVTEEDALNAIKFNCNAMMLQHLNNL